MHRLIEQVFRPAFANLFDLRHDGAIIGSGKLAFTTDSYVVRPLFFPGGDIGILAVNGTVNDLAMCGARPLVLSAGFILEEGLPMETLESIVESMRQAAEAARVQVVTGDTKVVDRGKGDGLYVNTSGIGLVEHPLTIAPKSVRVGDAIILSGDLGRHGISIMAVREGLDFETTIQSDCAPLAEPVLSLLEGGIEVHCLRDLTRGGLASALVEIAEAARVHIHIEENSIQVVEEVRGACEILGLDALYVANEGRFVAFLPANQVENALALLRRHPLTAQASLIGKVRADSKSLVTMTGSLGTSRVIDMLSGEQLPRIC
jgi:hydrogenase expression/formation protein HypE